MAILSNINDKFAVDSTGAIQFNGQAGTSGYVLKSNGNAAPTWVDASTVIGGPYLPLSGGTLTGATATASGISFTVGGALTGTTASFNAGTTNVVATFTSTDGIAGIALVDNSGNVELSASGNTFQVQPAGGAAALSVTSTSATFAGTIQTTQITATNGLNYLKRNTDASLQLRSENTRSGLFITKPATDTVMGSALVLADESYRFGTANYYHVVMLQNGNTYFNQNVGIGETSPDTKLHIKSATYDDFIKLERDGIGAMGISATNPTGIQTTNGAGSFLGWHVDSSGNVGINQTSPQALLSLGAGVDAQKLLLYDNNNNFKYGFGIQTAEFRQFFPNSATARMVFGTIDDSDGSTFSEKMRIDSSGNVGIGTSDIDFELQVGGTDVSGTGSFSAQFAVLSEATTGYPSGFIFKAPRVATSSNRVLLNEDFGTYFSSQVYATSTAGAQSDIPIVFAPLGGNVGIGTTSPLFGLSMAQGSGDGNRIGWNDGGGDKRASIICSSSTDALQFHTGTSDTERMRIDSSGKVAIGSQTANKLFNLADPAQGGETLKLHFEASSANDKWAIYAYDRTNSHYANMSLGENAINILGSNKNVGIGMTTPVNKIQANYAPVAIASLTASSGTSSTNWNRNAFLMGTGASVSNALAFGVSGTANDRKAWIQSGHPDSAANSLGTISLNPLGGNVGIGTTSPFSYQNYRYLQINGGNTTQGGIVRLTTSDGSYVNEFAVDSTGGYISSSSNFLLYTQNQVRLYVNSGGNVGIGVTSPSDKLEVTTSASQYTGRFDYTGSSGGAYGCLKLRISANTSPSFIDLFYDGFSTNPLSPVGAIVTTGSSVLYSSFSDYRLKENIADLTGALDKVNSLQPKTFNYINRPETTNEGFLAHELQEIVPQAVSGTKDGVDENGNPKYQGVDNAHLVPLLVGAIKELKADNDSLKARIETLENK